MWSQREPARRLARYVQALHSVLPAPRALAASTTEPLDSSAFPERVSEVLRKRSGFAWLDGGATAHYLFPRPLAVLSCMGAETTFSGPGGSVSIPVSGFAALEAALQAWPGVAGATLVGFLAYDLASELEQIGRTRETLPFPRLHFGLFDWGLRFDADGWSAFGTDAWRGRGGLPNPAKKTLPNVLRAAEELPRAVGDVPLHGPLHGPLSQGPIVSRPDTGTFEKLVGDLVGRIHQGDLFQANLCRRLEVPLAAQMAWPLYQRLRTISPAQYGAFLNLGKGRAVLSVSPESFLKVEGRTVASSPIKGTRPRGATREEDYRLAAELLASGKDRAELAMIVDVTRNDLGRVCETGSIRVEGHATLMTLPTVHHTVSTVTGQLRADASLTDLLRAAFPAASISGAPKIEAMKTILRAERQPRGPCMGSIGRITLDGDMDLSVAIRTAFTFGGRGLYYAGGGITAESQPAEELEESRAKATAFVKALGLAASAKQTAR